MIVIPAIDLLDGNAVRLAEGDRNRSTVYSHAPVELVDRFASAGATRIHVVDLDGAFAGRPVQTDLVAALLARAHERGVAIQVGGGMREPQAAEALLSLGVDRVVIGTLAVRDPEGSRALCARHPGRIIVAIDARDGQVSVDGWREQAPLQAADLGVQAEQWGAVALLHTDVARDGLQVGPAIDATLAIQKQVQIPVLASGGVGTLDHLAALQAAGIAGVVLGRALYEGSFTVEEALAQC